ncbi:hypothetical protein D3C72_965030 [compost metagenome]
MAGRRAGARRYHEGEHTEDERHRGHQDRAQAQPCRSDDRVIKAQSASLSFDCEFDDQDGVLRGEADDGDEADLEVDVVRHVLPQAEDQHAEHPDGGYQQYRGRDRPALVERGEAQEHHDDGERHQRGRGGSSQQLLIGLPRPVRRKARRQLLVDDVLEHLHGLPCRIARCRIAHDFDSGIAVIARLHSGCDRPVGADHAG